MRLLISGATGLVGTELVRRLAAGGHSVARLVRSAHRAGPHDCVWDPAAGQIAVRDLAGFDAVVHLAGENIAGRRWSERQKALIRSSRVESTRLLAGALAESSRRPATFVVASAIGYYGHRGADVMDETSAPGNDFLANVCQEWEAAADPARGAGIRTVHARFGVILSPRGGALQKMLLPFRLGLGGVLGSGKQYMSWITLDDAIGALCHVLEQAEIHGPVNVVGPHPVTNTEFTRRLGRALWRPTVFPVPAFGARLALGEMADALLLSSTRAVPHVLERSGYQFQFPELPGAFQHLLGAGDRRKGTGRDASRSKLQRAGGAMG